MNDGCQKEMDTGCDKEAGCPKKNPGCKGWRDDTSANAEEGCQKEGQDGSESEVSSDTKEVS